MPALLVYQLQYATDKLSVSTTILRCGKRILDCQDEVVGNQEVHEL